MSHCGHYIHALYACSRACAWGLSQKHTGTVRGAQCEVPEVRVVQAVYCAGGVLFRAGG
jgi:hypothetical protein